ncbi:MULTISPECIES: hypothetical protein [unclassified Microcoleus]|uniref:hypothetical protein n=1 Tax=unclassified Microcoleus TaxID=2642155 RepID=UPI002FD27179
MENVSLFNWIVKNNFPEADFWLINKGSKNKLGEPVKEFQPYLTGIKCPVLVLPDYAFYMCLHLYQQGLWQQYSQGSLNLQHLRLKNVKEVFRSIGNQHRIKHQARFKSFIPYPVSATTTETEEVYASL